MTENYLKALYISEEWGEGGLGVVELARAVSAAPSTVSENVRKLHAAGLVTHAPYQKVHLTAPGREAAVAIIRRHRILETYLYMRLGFEWDEVHEEAEILEHAISDRLLERMSEVLGNPERDPHGDPIPRAGIKAPARTDIPLSELAEGETTRIARISDADPALLRHLDSVGMVLDARIEILEHRPYAGTMKLAVTPPPSWEPRQTEALAAGVGPGMRSVLDLGDIAAASVWVLPALESEK